MSRRMGFYRKTNRSNKRLIELFERNQKQRYTASKEDWQNKEFTRRLWKEEIADRKEILGMLKRGEIRTSDDFLRAADFFHHGASFRQHALGLALFAVSYHLGELWGKNHYAVALDRFLISIKQPQYFVTQFEKKGGKWVVSPYRKGVTDTERRKYYVEPLSKIKETAKQMDKKIG